MIKLYCLTFAENGSIMTNDLVFIPGFAVATTPGVAGVVAVAVVPSFADLMQVTKGHHLVQAKEIVGFDSVVLLQSCFHVAVVVVQQVDVVEVVGNHFFVVAVAVAFAAGAMDHIPH